MIREYSGCKALVGNLVFLTRLHMLLQNISPEEEVDAMQRAVPRSRSQWEALGAAAREDVRAQESQWKGSSADDNRKHDIHEQDDGDDNADDTIIFAGDAMVVIIRILCLLMVLDSSSHLYLEMFHDFSMNASLQLYDYIQLYDIRSLKTCCKRSSRSPP